MNESLADQLRHLMPSHLPDATVQVTPSDTSFAWLETAELDDLSAAARIVFAQSAEDWIENSGDISAILVEIVRRQKHDSIALTDTSCDDLRDLYPQLANRPVLCAIALRVLIGTRDESALALFAELLVSGSVVLEPRLLIEVFGDLLQRHAPAMAAVFPEILNGLDELRLASFVLDYANFVQRKGLTEEHPATSQTGKLITILSTLAARLAKLQEARPTSEEEFNELGRQVTESVALGVAICDALSQIGDASAISSLSKTMEVQHRRLRLEAAAALAKLGVEDAGKVMLAMASEPAERLRVLAYAEELGLLEEVEEEFSNYLSQCEAKFVMYLTQPAKFGIAPQHVELIEQRELHWPGFEEPQTCFLFQFVYQFAEAELVNIGLAGPVVMTFDAAMLHLSYEDIYAMFAGWHVDHPDIYAVDADRTVGADQVEMERMLRSLTEAEEYEEVIPALLGKVLERRVLIASAMKNEETGWAIVGEDSVSWVSLGDPQRPVGAGEAFYLYAGRCLLKSFN